MNTGTNEKLVSIKFKAVADINDVKHNINEMQKFFDKLKLPDELKESITKIYSEAEKSAKKATDAMSSGFKNKGDVTAYKKGINDVYKSFNQLVGVMDKIDPSVLEETFKNNIDVSKLKQLNQEIENLQKDLNNLRGEQLSKIDDAINNASKNANSNAQSWTKFRKAIEEGDFGAAKKALNSLDTGLSKINTSLDGGQSRYDAYESSLKILKTIFSELTSTGSDYNKILDKISQKDLEKAGLSTQAIQEAADAFKETKQNAKDASNNLNLYKDAAFNAADGQQQLNSELDQFRSKISYFFGMNNAINLFKRAVGSAYNTVKDLDAVMTETAVVTDFSVGDMWSQLPEYTQRANELGVSIHSAYEAATLYYQQGLSTNEVMAVSNETLKMARIAGLDAATATDRMTNALRGFNMEINTANAQNINDVYSKLAAITASNVDEISTAMTKVASLANNANMEFETTAAFLSQIIETTRESAETAGTALKTVVARFSEVKDLYSKGSLTGTDAEGEAIDVNKVSTALRSAGINLNEYLTGMKGLDDIFIELASKWDSLDQVQQRYIATMAAGSRQQSRFIAMMSDYKRTTELVNAANNAAGASNEQFEKTLDSLETKLNKLKNAWDEFLMGLTNNEAIKFAVDALTGLITAINKLTSSLPGFLNSFSKLAIVFGGLKLGKSAFNNITADGGLLKLFSGESLLKDINFKEVSTTIYSKFASSIAEAQKKYGGLKNIPDAIFASLKDSTTKGLNQLKGAISIFKDDIGQALKGVQEYATGIVDVNKLSDQLTTMQLRGDIDFNSYTQLNKSIADGTITVEQLDGALKKVDSSFQFTSENADKFGVSVHNTTKSLQVASGALAAVGGAMIALGSTLEDKGEEFGSILKYLGVGLTTFGTIMSVYLPLQAQLMAKGVTGAIVSIPIVGWIAGIIAALTTLISMVVKFEKENTAEAKLEKAADAANEAAEAAQSAADSFNNLNDALQKIEERQTAIGNLATGTKEWRDEVSALNSEMLSLVQTYPELSKYLTLSNGILTWTDKNAVEEILNSYDTVATQANSDAAYLKIIEQQRSNGSLLENSSLFNKVTRAEKQITEGTRSGTTSQFISSQTSTGALEELVRAYGEGKIYSEETLKEWAKIYNEQNRNERNNSTKYTAAGEYQTIYTEDQYLFNFKYEDIVTELNSLSADIKQTDSVIAAQYKSIAANATELATLPDTTNEAINEMGNYLSQDRIQEEIDNQTERLSTINKDDFDTDEAYSTYFKQLYGENLKEIGRNGKITLKDGTVIEASDAQNKFSSAQATKELAKKSAGLTQTFDKLGKETESLRKIYDKTDGKALNQSDIESLTNLKYEQIQNSSKDQLQELADKAWNGLSSELKSYYSGNGSDFKQEFIDSITKASEIYAKAFEDMGNVGINTNSVSKSLTADTISTISDNILKVFQASGKDSAQGILDELIAYTKDMDTSDAELFMNAVGSIDWTNYNQVEGLSEAIDALGLSSKYGLTDIDHLEKSIIDVAKSSASVDFDTVKKTINSLNSMSYELASGKKTTSFTEDEMNALIEQNIASTTDFSYNIATNQYDYISDGAEKIVIAIRQQTSDLLGKTGLEAKVNSGKAAKTASESNNIKSAHIISFADGSQYWASSYEDLKTMSKELGNSGQSYTVSASIDYAQFFKDYFNALGDKEGIISKDAVNIAINGGNAKTLKELYDTVMTTVSDLDKNTQELNKYQQTIKLIEAQYYDPRTLVTKIAEAPNPDEQAIYTTALQNQANAAGVSTERINRYREFINNPNLKEEQLESASNIMANIIAIYQEAQAWDVDSEALEAHAKLIKANNQGMDEATAYAQALKEINLNSGYKKLVDEYDEWHEILVGDDGKISKQNTEEYRTSLTSLASTMSQLLGTTVPLNESFFESADIMEKVTQLANGEIGVLDDLRKAAAKSLLKQFDGIYGSEIISLSKKVNSLGDLSALSSTDLSGFMDTFNQIAKRAKLTVDEANAYFSTLGYNVNFSIDNNGDFETPILTRVIESVDNINQSIIDSANDTNDSKTYTNPYTELYNINERINEKIRERERLERKYQELLKKESTTAKEIRDAYQKQINALNDQQTVQLDRQREAKKLLNKVSSEYSDVSKYASYNTDNGEIKINIEALNDAELSEEEGKRFETYLKYLEEYSKEFEDATDQLNEIQDTIDDINQQAIDSYLSFEERILEAYVTAKEKEIDALENATSALEDANSKLISKLQEQINNERQARTNAQTESSITDQENRLAYLRRDTSGANQLEILQLEKSLEEARQNYSDSLIDQALEQIQSDADVAAEQRATQISLLREQLQQDKDNGALWTEVKTLIGSGVSEGSALATLLQASENFASLSNLGKSEWWNELIETYNTNMVKTAQELLDMSGETRGAEFDTSGIDPKSLDYLIEYDAQSVGVALSTLNGGWGKTPTEQNENYVASGLDPTLIRKILALMKIEGGWDADVWKNYYKIGNVSDYSKANLKQFASGGLADFTGPAWLDGSRANPEMVLSAIDTKNFMSLRDVLAKLVNGDNLEGSGDAYYDIKINAEIGSDYDVDQLADKIKKQITESSAYRNVNTMSFIR